MLTARHSPSGYGPEFGKFRGRKNLCCHDRDAPSRTRLYIASGDDYGNHRLKWTVSHRWTAGPSVGIDWFAIKPRYQFSRADPIKFVGIPPVK